MISMFIPGFPLDSYFDLSFSYVLSEGQHCAELVRDELGPALADIHIPVINTVARIKVENLKP